jgi:hypothetical protein
MRLCVRDKYDRNTALCQGNIERIAIEIKEMFLFARHGRFPAAIGSHSELAKIMLAKRFRKMLYKIV